MADSTECKNLNPPRRDRTRGSSRARTTARPWSNSSTSACPRSQH